MAQFAFTAKDPHGNTIQGNLAADSMTLATSKVEQMGYVVISVQAVPEVPGGGVPQQQPASPPYPSNASQPTTTIPSPPNRPLPTSLDPTRAMSVPPPSAPPAQEPTRTMPSANKP